MDEKKVREAIELIKQEIYVLEEFVNYGGIIEEKKKKHIGLYNTAIEALEKQLSKKVNVRTEFRDLNGEFVCFKGYCSICGCPVDSYRYRNCNQCGQRIDWSEE